MWHPLSCPVVHSAKEWSLVQFSEMPVLEAGLRTLDTVKSHVPVQNTVNNLLVALPNSSHFAPTSSPWLRGPPGSCCSPQSVPSSWFPCYHPASPCIPSSRHWPPCSACSLLVSDRGPRLTSIFMSVLWHELWHQRVLLLHTGDRQLLPRCKVSLFLSARGNSTCVSFT